MKNLWIVVLGMALAGCAVGKEKFEMYADNPEFLIKDPHFYQYQESLDTAEKEYLSKKITYAEYLKRKQELEDTYTRDVQKREKIITNEQ